VIDLASRSHERMIDVGADVAPHGVMMQGDTLWATAELGRAPMGFGFAADKNMLSCAATTTRPS
jgi:hypothetical protein